MRKGTSLRGSFFLSLLLLAIFFQNLLALFLGFSYHFTIHLFEFFSGKGFAILGAFIVDRLTKDKHQNQNKEDK